MGSRRNCKRKASYLTKRAKGQKQRRQMEKQNKIKDTQEVMSPPVAEDEVYTNNVISNDNEPQGQQSGMLPVTRTFGFPTPSTGIQSSGILLLLNPVPQAVLASPPILTVPQQNNTILGGVIPAKHKPTPTQNSSATSNDGVAFAQRSSVISTSDVIIRKEMPASSKNELDIIKENLISKGTEVRIIANAVPPKTADSHAKKILVSSKKVGSLSVIETPGSENDNRVPVKERQRQKCCIIGCGQVRTSNGGPSIHAFPKNDDLLAKWFDSIGNRMPPLSFGSSPVVCGQHFEQSCFEKTYNRKAFKSLKPGSVPTIFPSHSDATASITGNDGTRLVYDCQIKVEPADVAEPCTSEYLKAVKPGETPAATTVTGSETMDWNFSMKDMENPEKAKLYFLKVQNELALQKLQQKQPTVQSQPQTVHVKEEIVIDSDEEDGELEREQQKMKPRSTNFQREKWQVTGDKFKQDEFDAYAVTVVAKLRKMDLKQRMFAENMINNILYKGLMNQLSDVTQTTENPLTPPLQIQAMPSSPNVQQSQLRPLFALNINPPQIQGTFPVQSQTAFQNTPQNSAFSAISPSQTLGQFSTTPSGPFISNFEPWTTGNSAI